MRIVGITLLIMLMLTSSVFAVAPVNGQLIKAAQDYGVNKYNVSLPQFLAPWTAYEENAAKIDNNTERAYIYTPFLLIASNARERRIQGQPFTLADTEKILADYTGFLTFSVVLTGNSAQFSAGTEVTLRQGPKVINAYQISFPEAAVLIAASGKNSYTSQGYCYFSENDVSLAQPVMLVVTTADKREHRFYFNLAAIN